MRRITALWEAFYSKNLYSEAFHSWKGIGFSSLLILAAIQTLLICGVIHFFLQGFANREAADIVKQIPPITFKDGKASTPEARAYQIKDSENGGLIAIIDTTVAHPPADLGGAALFFASESVLIKQSEMEKRSYDFSSFQDTTIDEKFITYWLNFVANWAALICAPFILGFLALWRLIQLFLFSIVTLITCNLCGLVGDYPAKLRLTALALIPAIVVGMIFSALQIEFPGIYILFFAMALGYIYFGTKAAQESTASAEVPPPLP